MKSKFLKFKNDKETQITYVPKGSILYVEAGAFTNEWTIVLTNGDRFGNSVDPLNLDELLEWLNQ